MTIALSNMSMSAAPGNCLPLGERGQQSPQLQSVMILRVGRFPSSQEMVSANLGESAFLITSTAAVLGVGFSADAFLGAAFLSDGAFFAMTLFEVPFLGVVLGADCLTERRLEGAMTRTGTERSV